MTRPNFVQVPVNLKRCFVRRVLHVIGLVGALGMLGAAWVQSETTNTVSNGRSPAIRRFKIPRLPPPPGFSAPVDVAEVALGERLFLETRFAQFFHERCGSNVNVALPVGDPVMDRVVTTNGSLRGPFSGWSMNCRACHWVNEFRDGGPGVRTYADFARRSPIPARADGRRFTVRHAPVMVNASVPRERGFFLHWDGEFPSNEDLVKATLTGRNFGWLPEESETAARHVARVIRDDDGAGALAREFGGSYRRVLLGRDESIPEQFQLSEDLRMDVDTASDTELLDTVARFIGFYMDSLFFVRDEFGEYDGSPYDAFLETNRLPRQPDPGQSSSYYIRLLIAQVNAEPPVKPIPVTNWFRLVKQSFQFGSNELAGMRIFFARPDPSTNTPRHGIGNCTICHTPPDFTDFKFHNTGAAQEEYDALHGVGKFMTLPVPELAERNADPDRWLPPTAKHPRARGPFLEIPSVDKPGLTDLGLWNVYANPDQPQVQAALNRLLNGERRPQPPAVLLPKTIGLFKTPSVRGLALSAPYLHTGRMDTVEDVIRFYIRQAALARAGKLRNAAPELLDIFLAEEDIAPLTAFLNALNEDYE